MIAAWLRIVGRAVIWLIGFSTIIAILSVANALMILPYDGRVLFIVFGILLVPSSIVELFHAWGDRS